MTNRYLDSLSKLSMTLPLLMEKDEVEFFDLITSEILFATNAEATSVFIEKEGQLIRKSAKGLPENFFPEESHPNSGSVVGEAFTNDGIVHRNNISKELSAYPHYIFEYKKALLSHKFEHVIAVRFYSRSFGRPFGVIQVVNKLSPLVKNMLHFKGFNSNDLLFLQSAAQMLADTVELQCHAQRNQALLEISNLVGQSQSESEIYNTIVKHAKRAFKADQAQIAIYSPERQLAYIAAQFPINPLYIYNEESVPIFSTNGYKAVDWLNKHKKPLAIEDAQNDPTTSPAHEIIKRQKIQSFLLGTSSIKRKCNRFIGS